MLNLLDTYLGGFPLLIIGIIEIIVIIFIYGINYENEDTKRFPACLLRGFYHLKSDIEMMLGINKFTIITFYYFGLTWCLISPLVLLLVTILKAQQYKPITLGSYIYPDWANILGWVVVVFSLSFIPLWMIYFFITKDISTHCRPRSTWGPSQMPKQEWSVFINPYRAVRTRKLKQNHQIQTHAKSDSHLLDLVLQKEPEKSDLLRNMPY